MSDHIGESNALILKTGAIEVCIDNNEHSEEIGDEADAELTALLAALKQAKEENARLRAERDAAEERGWNLARERVYTPIGGWQNKYETYAEAVKEKNGSK